MSVYEVETDLLVHCRVKVMVEADDKDAAIDAASEVLPNNFDRERGKLWRANVELKPPKGVDCKVIRAYYFEQASGQDRARKVDQPEKAA